MAALKDLLQGDTQESVQPGFLRPIDVERIAQSLELDAEGTKRGAEERSGTTDELYDSVEQAVIQKVESEFNWQGGEFINQLRA